MTSKTHSFMHNYAYRCKRILIKLIIFKQKNVFHMTSIIFNYSLNTTLQSCATLNHVILGYLPLFIFYGSFESIEICDLVGQISIGQNSAKLALQNLGIFLGVWLGAPSWVHTWSLSHGEPQQNLEPQDLVLDISTHLYYKFLEEQQDFFLLANTAPKTLVGCLVLKVPLMFTTYGSFW